MRWLELLALNADKSAWAPALGREILRLDSPLRERFREQKLFAGHSLGQLEKAEPPHYRLDDGPLLDLHATLDALLPRLRAARVYAGGYRDEPDREAPFVE